MMGPHSRENLTGRSGYSIKGRSQKDHSMTERSTSDAALQHRIGFEMQITAISTRFIYLPADEMDCGIGWALKMIGEFAGDDRSYLFLFSDQGTRIDRVYEWCAEGIPSIIDHAKGIPVEAFPWWMDQLRRFESIHIPRVTDLPREAASDFEIFILVEVWSVLSVPVSYGGTLRGFIGFDSVRTEKSWTEPDIRLLM